jgi:hypothetical protein
MSSALCQHRLASYIASQTLPHIAAQAGLEIRGDIDNGKIWALYLEPLPPGAARTAPMLATAQTAINPKPDFIFLDVREKPSLVVVDELKIRLVAAYAGLFIWNLHQ